MFGKLFVSMYEGSLVDAGWEAIITLQQFVILSDVDGVVDKTPNWIARTTTIPLEIIKKGIHALEQPDPDSRTPDEEGRRIVRLAEDRAWGWRIVNYQHYRQIRSAEERREYHRAYWHKRPKASKAEVDEEELEARTQAASQYRQGLREHSRGKNGISAEQPHKQGRVYLP